MQFWIDIPLGSEAEPSQMNMIDSTMAHQSKIIEKWWKKFKYIINNEKEKKKQLLNYKK